MVVADRRLAQARCVGASPSRVLAANPPCSRLDAYWAGAPTPDAELTLDLHGSPFQQAVWRQLRAIAHGRTKSYGEVARAVGHGAVPRATGTACGRNPVGVIVPCHRVVGANGSLTGFSAGLARKEKLLQHEGVLLL